MHRYQERFKKSVARCGLALSVITGMVFSFGTPAQSAENAANTARVYKAGNPIAIQNFPQGKLRDRLEQLPPTARERALNWLSSFTFPEADIDALRADDNGGIYYADEFHVKSESVSTDEPIPESVATANGPLPVYPFPEALKFHSKPGAPHKIYVDFDGHVVSGTAWNTSLGRDPIEAVAFSSDTDFTTYSDSEQLVIKRVWQRMAEDFSTFDIDVTTEEPALVDIHTARALITRNTDVSGQNNPRHTAGGVAYVNVFGESNFLSDHSPAWIYYNNYGSKEDNIAETASHEIGHNLGLSHDGTTDGKTYYNGHGSGETRWAPIMGVSHIGEVTQWSQGEYYLANNTQDDLAIIAEKTGYCDDDHGDSAASSSILTMTDGTNIVSTTPENDPDNLNPPNKGIIELNTDTDVFAFTTGAGQINLNVNPWISPNMNRGGNLDVLAELRDGSGTLVAVGDPADETIASINTVVPEGTYYLHIRGTGTGSPFSSTPTGYTDYASLGQYFISGTIASGGGSFPPAAIASASDITTTGQGTKTFDVTYLDEEAIQVSTLDHMDIKVSGPNSYQQMAALMGVDINSDGSPRTATYAVTPPGGTTWMPADNGVYTIGMESDQVADIHGLYVASGELGTFNTLVPLPNEPPSVSMTSPAELASFTEGDSILMSASASDSDGSVVKVAFYVNNLKVGEDTQSPYSFTSSTIAVGEHTVYAKAFDNDGAAASSATGSFSVLPDTSTIAPPSNLAGIVSGSTVSLSWSDNTNHEDGYIIHRGLESGKGKNKTVSWSVLATLGANSNSYDDTYVANGTYYYKVEAFNSFNAATSATIKLTLGLKGGGKGKKK